MMTIAVIVVTNRKNVNKVHVEKAGHDAPVHIVAFPTGHFAMVKMTVAIIAMSCSIDVRNVRTLANFNAGMCNWYYIFISTG